MANFFIDRPIFAWVIAIIIMLAGAISMQQLAVAQYPAIAPPMITIGASYPGASAKTVEDTVTQIIEQNLTGIDNLTYFESTSDSTGSCEISLTFEAGTDADIAQVQVQNKLQLAVPLLPDAVQRQGISVEKSSASFLLVVAFVSQDGSMDSADVSDYVISYLKDPISRVAGVGEASVFGAPYSMHIWGDPAKFREYNLMPSDIVAAVTGQNIQVPGGQIGEAPLVDGQEINITINASSLYETTEQFENIILRSLPNGANLYLKDVARIDLSIERLSAYSRYNGLPASGLAIKLASGGNALETRTALAKTLAELEPFFPAGLTVEYPYDTTPFVEVAISGVYQTLAEAIFLVFCVMYLFLQDFRATLIPTIAIPVVLLGTFGVLSVAGFTINTLTMFAMVLAIGLLVDDAIVVVENVERIMREEKISPKEAAKKSMEQITGALIGIGMVICAVFIPMAFFGGSAGVIYRQFSITIISAMSLSVFVAIFLTPSLCATMLKGGHAPQSQGGFFGKFNRWVDKLSVNYQNKVYDCIRKPLRYLLIYAGCIVIAAFVFFRLPSAFFPDEDQGIIMIMAQLPTGSTFKQTEAVIEKMERYFLEEEKENVHGLITVPGFSFAGQGQNTGMGFVRLKDWSERSNKSQRVPRILERAMANFSQINEAQVFAFAPPAVIELGTAMGFEFRLLDRNSLGHEKLMAANAQIMGMIYGPQGNILVDGKTPQEILVRTRQEGLPDVDELQLQVDLAQAGAQGVNPADIYTTLSSFWAGTYINDFLDRGRTKKVYLQADMQFRAQEQDFGLYYVRNNEGEMVPIANFVSSHYAKGSPRLERFNGVPSLKYVGEPSAGKSTGEAMDMMSGLIPHLGPGFGEAWSGLSYQERATGAQAPFLYAISLLVVFLCLAALYESWSVPFSVMLVVPLGVLGAVGGMALRSMNNDIYFQVGMLAIIGLSAKNAILIVEFAKDLYEGGEELVSATVHAARLRLRPIIMTSLAFMLGVLPLAISTGAGSGSQNVIGTAVVSGTFVATVLGLFFTPIFFVLVSSYFVVKKPGGEGEIRNV